CKDPIRYHHSFPTRRSSDLQKVSLCDNYVMRSTRSVVAAENDPGLGHYSDPPLLVLASLASGPKHGHAIIEDIASICGTRLGPRSEEHTSELQSRGHLVCRL